MGSVQENVTIDIQQTMGQLEPGAQRHRAGFLCSSKMALCLGRGTPGSRAGLLQSSRGLSLSGHTGSYSLPQAQTPTTRALLGPGRQRKERSVPRS